MRLRIALATMFSVLCGAARASAQGCILCYTTASATSPAAQRSLKLGILALMVPALVLFVSVMLLLYRRAAASA